MSDGEGPGEDAEPEPTPQEVAAMRGWRRERDQRS